MVTGLPWWTFDAGGFFRPGNQYENEEYKEMLLRWLQVGTFLPLMRVHGYMSNTEPWRYGNEVDSVARKFIGMRYELMPYIYSVSASVSRDGYTMMRPLVMDFTTDENALQAKIRIYVRTAAARVAHRGGRGEGMVHVSARRMRMV